MLGSREHVTRHEEGMYWPRKCINLSVLKYLLSIFPSKIFQELIQYAQEMSQEAPGKVSRSQGVITRIYVAVTVVLSATKYASCMVIRIILQVHQFGFPGLAGNFHTFLRTFPGNMF